MEKYFRKLPLFFVVVSACVLTIFYTMSHGSEKIEDPIASVKFNLNEPIEWYSYRPIPNEKDEAPEKLSKHVYETLVDGIKTPKTRQFCVWRDTGNTRFSKEPVRPDYIFLTCIFGPKIQSYEPSSFALEDALVTRIGWVLNQNSYQMDRLEVEVYADKSYRSQNLRPDMKDIDVNIKSIKYPQNKDDSLLYDMQFNLPERVNSGYAQKQPIVNFEFKGAALPIPDWVNY